MICRARVTAMSNLSSSILLLSSRARGVNYRTGPCRSALWGRRRLQRCCLLISRHPHSLQKFGRHTGKREEA